MQVNNLLPVLLELLFTGQGKDKPPAVPRQTGRKPPSSTAPPSARPGTQPLTGKTGATAALTSGLAAGREGSADNDTTSEWTLLPLPLSSAIFPTATFYRQIFHRPGGKHPASPNTYRLVFGLEAPGLGELYFLITRQENDLKIECAAAREHAAGFLQENLPGLTSSLNRLGWNNVNISCFHLAKEGAGELITGLVDLKV